MNIFWSFISKILLLLSIDIKFGYTSHYHPHLNKDDKESICFNDEYIHTIKHGYFQCGTFLDFAQASPKDLPANHCHTQGIGASTVHNPFIITCQDKVDEHPGKGRILSYVKGSKNNLPSDTKSGYISPHGNHPSATQIWNNSFPVAFTQSSNTGPTTIHFYSIDAISGKLKDLKMSFLHKEGHIGALAYGKFQSIVHIVGCGWDCSMIAFWMKAYDSQVFTRYTYVPTKSIVSSEGIDLNVGSYNSLYLTSHCDSQVPLLVSTHSNWIDIWEIKNIGTPQVEMIKIAKRRINQSTTWGLRPLLLEGVTLVPNDDDKFEPFWLASPHDYDIFFCPLKKNRCMRRIYQCVFKKSRANENHRVFETIDDSRKIDS